MSKTKIIMSDLAMTQGKSLAFKSRLPDADATFLENLFEILSSHPAGTVIDRDEISEILKAAGQKHSSGLVTQRLRNLVKVGVISHTNRPVETVMCAVYELSDLSPLASLPRREQKKRAPRRPLKQIRQQELVLADDDSLHYLEKRDTSRPLFNDRLFMGILTAGMRMSANDPRQEILSEIRVRHEPIRIKTYCTSEEGSEIAVLADLRCARSLLSWAKQGIKAKCLDIESNRDEPPSEADFVNRFAINIYALLEFMDFTRDAHNLDAIRRMLTRLRQTEYEVDANDSPWFQQNLTRTGRSTKKIYRYLNNIEMVEEWRSDDDETMLVGSAQQIGRLKPIWYVFSFDQDLYESLVLDVLHGGGNLFLCHRELAKEKSGPIQRLYSWMRSYIGSREKPGLRNKFFSMQDLHEILLPSSRFDNFSKLFLRALSKKSPDGQLSDETTVLVYGYYIKVVKKAGTHYFNFRRDPSDPIVGDNSLHQQYLRQTEQDMLALEQADY